MTTTATVLQEHRTTNYTSLEERFSGGNDEDEPKKKGFFRKLWGGIKVIGGVLGLAAAGGILWSVKQQRKQVPCNPNDATPCAEKNFICVPNQYPGVSQGSYLCKHKWLVTKDLQNQSTQNQTTTPPTSTTT